MWFEEPHAVSAAGVGALIEVVTFPVLANRHFSAILGLDYGSERGK
jgi:hypothetical protein